MQAIVTSSRHAIGRYHLIRRYALGAMALTATLFIATSAEAQHDADLWVGRSGGALALSPIGLDPRVSYLPLERVDSFIHGWSANEPGWDAVTAPGGGVAPLEDGVQVLLEIIDLDPAFVVIDTGFQVVDEPGDLIYLGGADLHTHVTWFINEDDPAFDPQQCVWEATFRLVDEQGILQSSAPFTLLMTNALVRGAGLPGPADADGDHNENGGIDLADAAVMIACLNGPAARPSPEDAEGGQPVDCEVECHNVFDFNDDLRVDLKDVAALQSLFDG